MRRLLRRVQDLLAWRHRDRDIQQEMQFHLDALAREGRDDGLSEQEARSAAQRRFGSAASIKDRGHDERGASRLEDLARETRHTARRLLRAPAFTLAVVSTLALAIAANVTIFTVAYRVLLNPLPYPDADRVIVLDFGNPAGNIPSGFRSLTSLQYFQYRDRARTVDAFAVYQTDDATLSGPEGPERIRISRATPSLLSVLQIRPALGRWFTEEEGLPGAPLVTVLANSLWLERFGGDRNVLGRVVTLDGVPTEIVGVMPPPFTFPDPDVDTWVPVPLSPATASRGYSLSGLARLRDGADLASVRAELTRLTNELEPESPGNGFGSFVSTATPLIDGTVGGVSTLLWILLASATLVFLVAAANVANLVLVRTDARQREVAVRRALGAGRAGIARLFLTESTLLVGVSAALGVGLAWVAVRLFVTLGPAGLPRLEEVRLDAVSVVFTAVLGLLAAATFGAIPLWRRAPLARALHEQGLSHTIGRRHHRTRHLLMGGQVAVALVLLVASGLLVRSLQRLRAVDPGFDATSALTFQIGLPATEYPDRERVVAFHHAMLERLMALPGVTAVSSVSPCLPLTDTGFCFGNTLAVSGRTLAPGSIPVPVAQRAVAGDYFEAMGVRLLRGRGIDRADVERRDSIVVVNQALVDVYFPEEDPIGKQVAFGYTSQGPWRTIVGVIANTATSSLAERAATPKLYLPMSTGGGPDLPVSGLVGPDISVMSYVVRSESSPLELANIVRAAVGAIDADLAVARLRTLEEILAGASEQAAFTMVLLALAAGVALALGLVGIYGVVAYVVSQRTAEIGVRLALGAAPHEVAAMVVRQGGLVAAVGIAVGLGGALAGGRLLESLLYDISPRDPIVLATTTGLLLASAILASWLPARRAARVSPVQALRAD